MIERQKCPCCERFLDRSDYMLSEKFWGDETELITDETTFTMEIATGWDEENYLVPKIYAGVAGLKGDDGVIMTDVEIRFCPLCGRDLIDLMDAAEYWKEHKEGK